jgi:hypothetical protein
MLPPEIEIGAQPASTKPQERRQNRGSTASVTHASEDRDRVLDHR